MKVTLLSENIQKRITLLTHAISSKSQLPILQNILIETTNKSIRCLATDLEIGIEIIIPAVIDEEGAIAISAKTFIELITSLSTDKITIETQGEKMIVKTSKTKSEFVTMAKEEFPRLYEEKGEQSFKLKTEDIKREFSRIVFATSIDPSRIELSGILFSLRKKGEGTEISLVATDGYRLSLSRMEVGQPLSEEDSFLIPSRVIKEMLSLKEEGEWMELFVSKKQNQIVVVSGDVTLVGRLIEGQFPKYERIIPTEYTTKVTIDREELFKAVRTSAIFAREGTNVVQLLIQQEKITVVAKSPSVGESTTETEVKLTGDDNTISFNTRYLLDLLSVITEKEIVFEMTGPLSPGSFKLSNDPSFLHIIMPVRQQEN